MQNRPRWCVPAGVALVGASALAAAPVTAPLPDVHGPDIQLTAGEDDAQDIVIDIVRHGERLGVANLVVPSPPHPGAPLSDLGHEQAREVAHELNDKLGDDVSGIFSGQGQRDVATARPFAEIEGQDEGQPMDIHVLPGLNEIDGGILGGVPHLSPGGILYALISGAWGLGLTSVPMPGSGQDPNGVVFNEKFTSAVQTMYEHAMDNPVVSDNGEITAVAFNNEASIVAWVLMNVENPDLSYFGAHGLQAFQELKHPILPVGHYVKIKGNPEEGWSLVSWDGTHIDQTPGLLTDLFVDFRDLIMPPQAAAWHISQAVLGGDPDQITDALQTGLQNVGEALFEFPGAVFNDIVEDFSELATATTTDEVLAALI